MIAWGAKVSAEFRAKVSMISSYLGMNPSHLMACMAFETGRTFSPSVKNPRSSATGLIQFMRDTAIGLGTTVEQLARMTAEEQLDYVYSYFKPYAGRLATLGDVYMAILWPKAVGQPDEYIVFGDKNDAYAVNKGLDFDHDGAVTKAECTAIVQKILVEGLTIENRWDEETQEAAPIVEKSETLPPQPKGETMGVAAGLLAQLVPQILSLFSSRIQGQVQKATGADPAAIQTLFQSLLGQAGTLVGIPVTNDATAIQAVAKLTADPSPATVQALEAHVLDYLDKIAPLLDKLAEQDRARWDAQVKAADAASLRAKGDRVELAPALVKQSDRAFLAALILTGVGLSIQMWFSATHTPDGMLMGLFTILIYCVARTFEAPYRYRFGGTVDSTATEATTDTIKTANTIKGKP